MFEQNGLEVVLGPPGTGKTTRLLDLLEAELKQGTPPERIAFTTFTRRGAEEAQQRAIERFGFKEHQLPHFRTLHSLAYRESGITRNQVVDWAHYRQLGDMLSLDITGRVNTEEGVEAQSKRGDKLLHMVQLSRARNENIKDTWEREGYGKGLLWEEVLRFYETYQQFKTDLALVDFNDMLQLAEYSRLDVDVAFIDEAQDLSLEQWAAAQALLRDVKRIVVAGDDDQAIYRWAGADVTTFLTLGRQVIPTVLDHSYRLPVEVWKLAQVMTAGIVDRLPKKFSAKDDQGAVFRIDMLGQASLHEGDWLILARNKFFLKPVIAHLKDSGIPFDSPWGGAIDTGHREAIKAHTRLTKTNTIGVRGARAMYKLMPGKDPEMLGKKTSWTAGTLDIDVSKPWFEVLTKMPLADRTFYRSILRRHGSLNPKGLPRVGTIHSAKGTEADFVLLIQDQTMATFEHSHRNPDDELRVWYVGATRAKKALYLLRATSSTGVQF